MNALTTMVVGSLSLVGGLTLRDLLHLTIAKTAAFEKARELSNGKGIVNIGAGPHRTYQAQIIAESSGVMANIDIAPNGMPHFIQLDIEVERLPFSDKHFGVAFLSHILEHLDNWQYALEEAIRVADYAVVVLPHPAYFSGWLDPQHKQHFTRDEIDEIVQFYANVEIYY